MKWVFIQIVLDPPPAERVQGIMVTSRRWLLVFILNVLNFAAKIPRLWFIWKVEAELFKKKKKKPDRHYKIVLSDFKDNTEKHKSSWLLSHIFREEKAY